MCKVIYFKCNYFATLDVQIIRPGILPYGILIYKQKIFFFFFLNLCSHWGCLGMILCQQTSLWSCVRRFVTTQIVTKKINETEEKTIQRLCKGHKSTYGRILWGESAQCVSTWLFIKASRETNQELRPKVLARWKNPWEIGNRQDRIIINLHYGVRTPANPTGASRKKKWKIHSMHSREQIANTTGYSVMALEMPGKIQSRKRWCILRGKNNFSFTYRIICSKLTVTTWEWDLCVMVLRKNDQQWFKSIWVEL